MLEKNKVIVKIRNKEYIICSADSQEYILSVANELDLRIRETASENSALNPERLMILAALNLCDDFMKLKQEYNCLQDSIKEQSYRTNIPDGVDNDALEQANARIKLLEARLTDDDAMRKEIDDVRVRLTEEKNKNQALTVDYEKQIADLKRQLADKENEWLEMIDKM